MIRRFKIQRVLRPNRIIINIRLFVSILYIKMQNAMCKVTYSKLMNKVQIKDFTHKDNKYLHAICSSKVLRNTTVACVDLLRLFPRGMIERPERQKCLRLTIRCDRRCHWYRCGPRNVIMKPPSSNRNRGIPWKKWRLEEICNKVKNITICFS